MHKENTTLTIIGSIAILGAVMVYRNKNVSLLEFRLLLFLFFVPVLVEYLLFQRQYSTGLKRILFFHLSSFIIVTIALYVRENEQIFFGLFFAGFLIILLSYFMWESVRVAMIVTRLFTGSIAFWVVISYFPLSPFLSVVFGAVAFFLAYIFFEIPGKIVEPSPALMHKTKEPERVIREEVKQKTQKKERSDTLLQETFERMTKDLNQLLTDMKTAPFSEYSRFNDLFVNIQSLYSEKADAYQKYIFKPELEKFHTRIEQCATLLLTMKNAEKDWITLKAELTHMKVNAADIHPDQVNHVYDQVSTFWSNYEQMIPRQYAVMIQKELATVEETVLKYEKLRKEWNDLKRAVHTFMKIPFADRTECELIKERFNSMATTVEQCVPHKEIEEVRQKIGICETRIALIEEWNTLVKTLDATQNPEEIAALKEEFLSNINRFASVIPSEEISWVKTRFEIV